MTSSKQTDSGHHIGALSRRARPAFRFGLEVQQLTARTPVSDNGCANHCSVSGACCFRVHACGPFLVSWKVELNSDAYTGSARDQACANHGAQDRGSMIGEQKCMCTPSHHNLACMCNACGHGVRLRGRRATTTISILGHVCCIMYKIAFWVLEGSHAAMHAWMTATQTHPTQTYTTWVVAKSKKHALLYYDYLSLRTLCGGVR